MAVKRKTIFVTVKMTMPHDMKPADARREVKSLVNDQCNYYADVGDVKAVAVTAKMKS